MTKKHFFITVGLCVSMIVAYGLFTLRQFFVHPPLVLDPRMSPAEITAIWGYFKSRGGFPPEPFEWKEAVYVVSHPNVAAVSPATLTLTVGGEIRASHKFRSILFRKTGETWVVVFRTPGM